MQGFFEFFRRAKFDTNSPSYMKDLAKYKGKRTSRECTFIYIPFLTFVVYFNWIIFFHLGMKKQ